METAPAGDRPTPADPSDQAPLLPGLLAAFKAPPPDRGLFREHLLQTVGRGVHTYIVNGQRIAAATIKVIAWTLYGRMDRAGMVVDPDGKPYSRQTLAAEASVSPRTLTAGIAFLDTARCTGRRRGRGRRRDVISINPGGLTWPACVARIAVAIKARDTAAGDAVESPRTAPLPLAVEPRSGAEVAPLEGYVQRATGRREDRRRPDRSHKHRVFGGAAATPGIAREADQQQQPTHHHRKPTDRQLRGIADMGDELREAGVEPFGPDRPVTRSQASEVFRRRKRQVTAERDPNRRRALGPRYRREVEPDQAPADFEAAAPEVDPDDDDPARARAWALLRGEEQ